MGDAGFGAQADLVFAEGTVGGDADSGGDIFGIDDFQFLGGEALGVVDDLLDVPEAVAVEGEGDVGAALAAFGHERAEDGGGGVGDVCCQ